MKKERDLIETHLKPRDYSMSEVSRIVNPKQCMLYIKNGIYPIDIYTSIDNKTDNDIVVMIFLKEESYPLYQKWCDHELE